MNILPKKRWHVRTKENIARVRKDEAEAAQKQREEELRIENADREARLNILKNKSKQRLLDLHIDTVHQKEEISTPLEHVNLFADLDHATTATNREHDIEVKEKKEEYEKKIGYLTYLGQDTNEALGKKNWYEILPESSRYVRSEQVKDSYDKLVLKDKDGKAIKRKLDEKDGEIDWKLKQCHDPINNFKKYCEGKQSIEIQDKKLRETKKAPSEEIQKDKKSPKHKREKAKETKLQQLREARLKREQQEKQKTELFLKQLNGSSDNSSTEKVNKIKPKYNSQFNPELARQNYR